MPGLLPVLTPILLVDMLNPVLLAFLVFAAGSKRPVINSSAMLLGHTASYFIAGIALSYAVDAISKRMAAPQAIDYIIGAVLGLALVFFALKPSKPSSEPDLPEIEPTPLKCFSYGAIINMIGLPFAVPYLGAVDQILKANLSFAESLAILGAYNIAYALPFALVPMLILVMGDASRPLLEKFNKFMIAAADRLMPWLFLALGLWLIADAVNFFFVSAD